MRCSLIFAAALLAAESPEALRGLDPVLLVDGREAPGRQDLTREHNGFQYRFSSPATLARFDRDPAAFEIQFDGACGKMGPASGAGDPARFWVFERRIYVFASDSCLRSFQSNPGDYVERPAAPDPDAASLKRGRLLLSRAIEAHGGAAIDQIQTYDETVTTGSQPAPNALVKRRWILQQPGLWRSSNDYQGWGSEIYILTGQSAVLVSGGKRFPLGPTARRSVQQGWTRTLLGLLLARSQPGFLVFASADHEFTAVHQQVLIRATLDPATGRVIRLTSRDRGPGGPFGEVTQTFSDFRTVQNLVLPFATATTYNGKPWLTRSHTTEAIRVNQPVEAGMFQP